MIHCSEIKLSLGIVTYPNHHPIPIITVRKNSEVVIHLPSINRISVDWRCWENLHRKPYGVFTIQIHWENSGENMLPSSHSANIPGGFQGHGGTKRVIIIHVFSMAFCPRNKPTSELGGSPLMDTPMNIPIF